LHDQIFVENIANKFMTNFERYHTLYPMPQMFSIMNYSKTKNLIRSSF